ncbi:MAG: TonB-dependent receptor plug domain-containing protein [Opitutaceae bacterium]|jgi:outer membrane receptor protein involved in Fe transport|nr:TonB-dependent receptor plug domain-containing protein [Opitutaceae bacterium]
MIMKNLTYMLRAGLAGSLFFAAGAALFGQAVTRPARDVPPAPPKAAVVAAAPAAEADEGGDVVVLEEFHVKTRREASYLGAETTAGARVVADVMDMPFSIQVLSKDFIDDFQLFTLEEQGAYISGMVPDDPSTGFGGNTSLRGYGVPHFRNGFRRTQIPEQISIKHTEVIRGPQSALFGRAAPGGVVNSLSKDPQTKFRTAATAIWGSYDYQRANAYVTGPLVPKKLYYRVDMEYYDMERNTDYYFNRTTNLFGSVRYKFDSGTTLTAEIEHTDKRMNDYSSGNVRYIDRSADPTYADMMADPTNLLHQHPDTWLIRPIYEYPDRAVRDRLMQFNAAGPERRTKRASDSYYLQFAHRFASDISMRVNFGYSKRDFRQLLALGITLWDPDRRADNRDGYNKTYEHGIWGTQSGGMMDANKGSRTQVEWSDYDYNEYGFQIDFTKTWRTPVKQSSLLTFDYFRNKDTYMQWALSDTDVQVSRGDDGSIIISSNSSANFLRDAVARAMGYMGANDIPVGVYDAWRVPDPFNLDPRYGVTPAFNSAYDWRPRYASTVIENMYGGIYNMNRLTYGALLSHQVQLFDDRVYIIGTLRQDFSEVEREYPLSPLATMKEATGNARAMSYSGGVTYGILENKKLVAFVSYGKSFDPGSTVDPNVGAVYSNLRARGVDGGFKGVLRGKGGSEFRYTVSLYQITQENEVIRNPESEANYDDKSIPYYLEGGSTRGKGMSVEVAGQDFLVNGLRLNGNIAWLDKTYLKFPGRDDPSQPDYAIGQRTTRMPARTMGAGVSYSPRGGPLKGFGLGVSYTYSAKQQLALYTEGTGAAIASAARYIPPQEFWGGFINYRTRVLKKHSLLFRVNVLNLTDNMVITPAGFMPNGREIRGTVTLEF